MNSVMVRAISGLLLALAWVASCGIDDRPPSWSYIHEAIIEPNCTTSACHSKISAAFGISLHDREGSYSFLTGRVCGQEDSDEPGLPDRNFVDPGDPSRSRLLYLMRGIEVDRTMPPDIPLPERDIELVEEWILRGAPCD